jgi:hypothetical protein
VQIRTSAVPVAKRSEVVACGWPTSAQTDCRDVESDRSDFERDEITTANAASVTEYQGEVGLAQVTRGFWENGRICTDLGGACTAVRVMMQSRSMSKW